MRARDRHTAGAIRTLIAALENAEAVRVEATATPVTDSPYVAGAAVGLGASEVPRRVLAPHEERALVAREVADLRQAAQTLATAGRQERSAELLRFAETVERLLEADR
jgi:type VI protein secretion system component VasF